jgi:SAM-dependent MidA family methyltransferase
MCWTAMLLRVTASMRSNWKSTGRPISIRLVDLGPGADGVVERLVTMVRRLAGDVAAMGSMLLDMRPSDWAEAAE